ncbi:hypothetical protein TNCV_5137121 [Trichonephila clavipes]|nr:hypothetical protein TNCV_5137121 [Trichonephila clavipes]
MGAMHVKSFESLFTHSLYTADVEWYRQRRPWPLDYGDIHRRYLENDLNVKDGNYRMVVGVNLGLVKSRSS